MGLEEGAETLLRTSDPMTDPSRENQLYPLGRNETEDFKSTRRHNISNAKWKGRGDGSGEAPMPVSPSGRGCALSSGGCSQTPGCSPLTRLQGRAGGTCVLWDQNLLRRRQPPPRPRAEPGDSQCACALCWRTPRAPGATPRPMCALSTAGAVP